LIAAGADPESHETVTPALSEPLEPGMRISAPEVFTRVTQEETTLTPEVEIQRDPTMPKGERRVVDKGTPGRLLRVYRVVVTSGVEGEPGLSAEKVVSEAEPRVVAVGTGATSTPPSVLRNHKIPPAPKVGRRMRVETTAYSPREPGLDFTTATGARAKRGVIAVDPRVIPLGTRVYVPGYGYAVARDTGGAIKGKRVDLCFDTVAECIRWGRRSITIIIVDQ
jgi:3D (Asp-Asp-Asp) domain-containing protein